MESGVKRQPKLGLILLAASVCLSAAITTVPCYAQTPVAMPSVDTTAPAGISSANDLVQWMTYYYLHPQPNLLVPALLFADTNGLIDKGQAPLTAFVSRVFALNPERISGWVDQLNGLSAHAKPMLWSALWWSNTVQGKETLNKLLQTLPQSQQEQVLTQMAKPAEPIEKMEMNHPEVLDELWGAWSATGDEKYVDRLMSALPWLYSANGDYNKLSIGGAARWSLASNAAQHPRVLGICMKARSTAVQPQLRKLLDQVIAEATRSGAPAQQQASTRPPQ